MPLEKALPIASEGRHKRFRPRALGKPSSCPLHAAKPRFPDSLVALSGIRRDCMGASEPDGPDSDEIKVIKCLWGGLLT